MEQDKLEYKPDYASAVSTAMRRPLTDLFSHIRSLAAHEELLTPYLRQELEGVLLSGYRLLRVADSISAAEKYEPAENAMTVFPLWPHLREGLEAARLLLGVSGSTLQYDLPETRETVRADEEMLMRAVLHLISNALDAAEDGTAPQALSLGQEFRRPGAKEVMLCFFCYCALETTAGLWASSYLTLTRGVAADTAASFASLFYIGITAGRAACGFLTLKLSDTQMIRLGQGVLAVGVAALLVPGPQLLALAGLVLVGVGCAPIYPSIIHATPDHFGADRSQAVIGIQMASAYVGNLVMPPLFGLLANNITPALFPFYLLVLLVLMVFMHEQLVRKTSH